MVAGAGTIGMVRVGAMAVGAGITGTVLIMEDTMAVIMVMAGTTGTETDIIPTAEEVIMKTEFVVAVTQDQILQEEALTIQEEELIITLEEEVQALPILLEM